VTSTGMTGGTSWGTDDNKTLFLPTDVVKKYEDAYHRKLEYLVKYNADRPTRNNGHIPMAEREFVVWDGEGPKDTGYSLLGNSEGFELCSPNLDTISCLDFILECGEQAPNTIHVSFGFNYDVSNILKDIGWRHLSMLHQNGRILWSPTGKAKDGYKIEHVPRKWFRVEKDGISVKIFDVISFFATSLVGALTKWDIGPFASLTATTDVPFPLRVIEIPTVAAMEGLSEAEIVQIFKGLRSEFLMKDMPQIRRYMRLELKYTKILMEKLRSIFTAAGFLPTSWHGPAALSRVALAKNKVYDAMAISPPDVQIAARYAFFGGRFEQFFGGIAHQQLYCADINSAYPYYCTFLPNLNRGKWRRTRNYEPGKFAVYYVRYHAPVDRYGCFPLPHRDSDHNVVFPYRTEGWYWAPEAALCRDSEFATITEGWVFDEDDPTDRPFRWIEAYYRARQALKAGGNPAEFTYKLIINAIYGCLAQRSGWDKKKNKPPKSHQLEWAGFITSACRAQVYRVASTLGPDLVSIDTDGITSLRPFDGLVDSKELGGWELSEFQDGLFWQSGIYALQGTDGKWKTKMRGIERDTYTVEELFGCYNKMEPLKLTRQSFVSYGLALQGLRESLNTWSTEDVEYAFGGNGKRQHRAGCGKACDGDHHRFGLWSPVGGRTLDFRSHPHALPWISGSAPQKFFDDLTAYQEEEWRSIAEQVN
jgi:hypothetical protein